MDEEHNDQESGMSSRRIKMREGKTWHPIWFGVGFTILPFIVLLIGYVNIHPSIWRSLPERAYEQSPPEREIAWREDEKSKPPLKYLRDGFVFVTLETDTAKVENFWSLFVTPSSSANWKWHYEVKNLTENDREIEVRYYLVDQNGSEISTGSSDKKIAKPGETITLEGVGVIPYNLVNAVAGSSWEIR
jgi:hypothetical protein